MKAFSDQVRKLGKKRRLKTRFFRRVAKPIGLFVCASVFQYEKWNSMIVREGNAYTELNNRTHFSAYGY